MSRSRAPLYLAVALLFQLGTWLVQPEHDRAVRLFMAQRQAQGQMPGRDLWDNKLPPIYLVGRAALLTGAPLATLWLAESLLTAMGALAVAATVQRVASRSGQRLAAGASRAATLAGLLLCVASGWPAIRGGGYMTEVYAMPLSAVAVWLALGALAQPKRRDWGFLAAGLAWGLAVAFRPPLGIAAIAVIGGVLLRCLWPESPGGNDRTAVANGRGIGLSAALRCGGAHLAGATVAVGIVLAHPLAAGYLEDCWGAAILWPLGLTGAHVPGPLTPSSGARLTAFAQDVGKIGWLHAAAIAGLVLAARRGAGRPAKLIALWYLLAAASALVGWNHFAHYHYVILAPLCVGAGLLACFWTTRRARQVLVAILALTAVLMLAQNVKAYVRGRQRAAEPDQNRLAAWLSANTTPDQTVFLWISGRDADLLRRVNRPPGVRHFLARSYTDMDLALLDEWAAEFVLHPPDWLAQDTRGQDPQLTRLTGVPWESGVPALRRVQAFVARHYHLERKFGPFEVWRRGWPPAPETRGEADERRGFAQQGLHGRADGVAQSAPPRLRNGSAARCCSGPPAAILTPSGFRRGSYGSFLVYGVYDVGVGSNRAGSDRRG